MILGIDIGGTHTRLGLFTAEASRPASVDVRTYATGGFASLESMLAAFLADAGVERTAVTGAGFGVAGPVVHGRAALTNAAWLIDGAASWQGDENWRGHPEAP